MYGALLGVAGAGLGAYGAYKQQHALSAANRQNQQDLQAYYAQQKAAQQGFQRQYEGVNDARLNGIGGTLQAYMAPEYGQQAEDTALIDQSLAQVGGGSNPGADMGGAAHAWGRGVAERTGAATGRQRMVAGDASMLRRVGSRQSGALLESGIDDQRYGHQISDIRAMEQLRNAGLEDQLQQVNMRGQNRFDRAQNAGKDWTTVGSLMGAGGNFMDAWNGSAAPAQQKQFDTGSNQDYFRR
jgi:hypothetical protein